MNGQQPITIVKYDHETKSRETDDLLDKPWQRGQLSNVAPKVYDTHSDDEHNSDTETDHTDVDDPYCSEVRDEVFSLIRHIRDPEHPHTLEELRVVRRKHIGVTYTDYQLHIVITYKPTVPHCSLATLIGLCIRTKIINAFEGCKLDIYVLAGSHSTEAEINQQLNDKERACAAMENPPLRDTVLELIKNDTPLAYNE